MSPHAVLSESPRERVISDLKKFAVTRNAFLPQHKPLSLLPHAYYTPWEYLASHLSILVENGIREAVHALPLLSTDRLATEAEWRRAYVILAHATHAYVWGGDEPAEVSSVFNTLSSQYMPLECHTELRY